LVITLAAIRKARAATIKAMKNVIYFGGVSLMVSPG